MAIALSSSASADEVVVQDAQVTNVGDAVANSGGNVTIANASQNQATTNQTAVGGLAANSALTSNSSTGTATINAGAATATGNDAQTSGTQSASGGGGGGFTVAVQDADVVNDGDALANSGLNGSFGNLSESTTTTNQTAVGLVAANTSDSSNTSSGNATVNAGPATATGNRATTGFGQSTTAGDGAGLLIAVQDASVSDTGDALANSGLNFGVGNDAQSTDNTTQVAIGLLASNAANVDNASSGTAAVTTGAAGATGNQSETGIAQAVSSDPNAVAFVFQSAPIAEAGTAGANSGLNFGTANSASNVSGPIQVVIGLLAANAITGGNTSDGVVAFTTGNAWAVANDATHWVSQTT